MSENKIIKSERTNALENNMNAIKKISPTFLNHLILYDSTTAKNGENWEIFFSSSINFNEAA